jgi:translation initiation factor 2 subunit 2
MQESIPVEKPVSTPAPAPAVDGDEPPAADAFDLSDLKKRKKSSKKKAQMDLEAFEKELGAEKSKEDEEGEGEGGEDDELGEDPFAATEDAAPGVVGINTGREPWIGSERDYKYTEVCFRYSLMKSRQPDHSY